MKIKLAHGVANLIRAGNGWYLDSIIVDEAYRNQGIGHRLMERVINRCNPPIYLLASSELGGDVAKLYSFYREFGFEKIKPRKSERIEYNYNMVLWGGQ